MAAAKFAGPVSALKSPKAVSSTMGHNADQEPDCPAAEMVCGCADTAGPNWPVVVGGGSLNWSR